MTSFPSNLDDEAFRNVVEALIENGQAVFIYDADDSLRQESETYRGMFLVGYEGPFTFPDLPRHGAAHGLGVRIDDGDVEALLARTLPRRRSSRRKSFETDLLTGLPNRRYIMERLDEALAASRLSGSGLCAAIIDIDHFKDLNDTYGHDAGDAVLRHFAEVCRERLRPEDHIGRIGGEEFLLLLTDVRPNDAGRVLDGVRAGFPAATLPDHASRRPVAFSAGLTDALPHDDRSSILYRADRALYAAKAEGRNRTKIGFGELRPQMIRPLEGTRAVKLIIG